MFDSTLKLVRATEGSLDVMLAPGVYRIQGRVGVTEETQLIMLAPGADERRDLSVEFAGGAPVYGTRTMNETHGALAHHLSTNVGYRSQEESGAVLVLRTLRDSPSSSAYADADRVRLLNADLRQVSPPGVDWTIADSGTLGWGGRLAPGAYVLRTDRGTEEGSAAWAESGPTDQTIWLCPGWQTLVFVPNTPFGPDARGISVHMVPLFEPWEPTDPTALAVEASLAGLRDGVPPSPNSILDLNHEEKANPMLAILALHREPQHTLLKSSWVAYSDVIRRLEGRLRTAHPDVLAAATRLPGRARELPEVRWPPMLATSYRHCLLPADAEDSRVLLAGSPAERVAAFLRPSQPWLQWVATRELLAGRYTTSEDRQLFMPPRRAPGAAVDRVQRAVSEIASFQEVDHRQVVDRLGSSELARRCELPETLVAEALRDPRLQRFLDLPGEPGGKWSRDRPDRPQ
ncbi:hypothetical protein [Streptomyces katrae]|uniref:hypothetical protein n=1 Tax=Streptomyces katrae TaxID=68223 RepID=UPI00131DAABC|nr:hypothetical protein [Streptomyces katrae]